MPKSTKHPLSDDERDAILMLRGVTMPVGSWDKRFTRDVLFPALETGDLGDKSAPQLWRIFIKYRRQTIPHRSTPQRKTELLGIAEQLAAPDFRKQQAALRAQERIDFARHCAGGPVPPGLRAAYPPSTIDAVKRQKQLQEYQRQERLTSL